MCEEIDITENQRQGERGKESESFTILFYVVSLQALIVPDKFQHILRVLNTNIDGRQKIMFGLTAIKVGRVTYGI